MYLSPVPTDDDRPATRREQIAFWIAVFFIAAVVLLVVAGYYISNRS